MQACWNSVGYRPPAFGSAEIGSAACTAELAERRTTADVAVAATVMEAARKLRRDRQLPDSVHMTGTPLLNCDDMN
jgi:hypothetical protein